MKRLGFRLLAATALSAGLGLTAYAQDSGAQDCPEDMDNKAGCPIDDAPVSERQPVAGAATAPVEPSDAGGEGAKTMENPGDVPAEAQESDASGATGGDASKNSGDMGSAHPDVNLAAEYEEGGRWYNSDDVPTFNISEDGTVDWATFSGYRRYNAECFQCHGPDGAGGSYAPAIMNSVMNMDYYDFYGIVVNGKRDMSAGQNRVMPSLGENPNVMCYLDDIYVYLRARGSGELGRGRPAKKAEKSEAFTEAEDACMG